MQWRGALWAVVLATATFVDARAETEQPAVDATAALAGLQAEQNAGVDRFVPQEVLDPLISPDGGGACATAAAIDLLQGLRVVAGMEPLANPHKERTRNNFRIWEPVEGC